MWVNCARTMLSVATAMGGGNEAQMTLEQHRFEMHGSTYMWIVFNSKYTVLHNLGFVKSMDANHGYKRSTDYRPILNC